MTTTGVGTAGGVGAAGGAGGASSSSAGGAGAGGQGGGNPLDGMGTVGLVQGGFQFVEGPTWRAALGVLLFSDEGGTADTIYRLTPPSAIDVFRHPSGNSNGLTVDPQGLLIACEQTPHRVTRTETDGTVTSLADSWQGLRLNSPNDVVVRSDGTIYFTDPPYGVAAADRQLTFQGVYRIHGGVLDLVDDSMTAPNGIAVSVDGSTLYVDDSEDTLIRRFDIHADGSTGAGSLFLTPSMTPDGMVIDDFGNLYVSTVNGVEVYSPTGMLWGTISVPEQPANVAFGDTDRKTLYITARTSLYRVKLTVSGKP